MNPQALALQNWKQQKTNYEKSIKTVISQLIIPIKFIPSPTYEDRLEQLKEILRYNQNYEQDDSFTEIYVHYVAGKVNITLMQLANNLVNQIGGVVKFWQNRIMDIAEYVNYHTQLSIWEVNRVFQKYMGLSPELTSNLRKKKSLAKHYLSALTAIIKAIDKCKPFHEDLLKIDECYKKLKKIEQKYYAFLEETEKSKMNQNSNISTKGKNSAKSSLFLFLKPKEVGNTLINYNFKTKKETNQRAYSLLKGIEYEKLDQIFNRMKVEQKSQKINNSGENSQTTNVDENLSEISKLRNQFMTKNQTNQQKNIHQPTFTYIWSPQYFFTYWGYPIRYQHPINYSKPYDCYPKINYQIDSEEEFDQLNAEDINQNQQESSLESDSIDENSFVISDSHQSEDQQQQQKLMTNHFLQDRWVQKISSRWANMNQSLSMEILHCHCESQSSIDPALMSKIHGKGRTEIINIFQEQYKDISKNKIDTFLRQNFKKIKKQRKVIYLMLDKYNPSNTGSKSAQSQNSEQQTNQCYQISISYASRRKQNSLNNQTIYQESNSQLTLSNPK